MSMRRRYIGLGHSFDASVAIVMFKREKPIIHAKRRTDSDSRGHNLDYWLMVAENHEKQYEPPNQSNEGFDEILHWDFKNKSFK